MYKVLIVFNKVDTFEDVRDFARTYGSLCWNLSRVVRTKDIPHIYCTFIEGIKQKSGSIDLSDFKKSTDELKREIGRVGQRRKSNLVSSLLDSGRQLRMHASICKRVGWRMAVERSVLWSIVVACVLGGTALLWYLSGSTAGLVAGIAVLLAAVGLGVASTSILALRLHHHIALLDKYFRE